MPLRENAAASGVGSIGLVRPSVNGITVSGAVAVNLMAVCECVGEAWFQKCRIRTVLCAAAPRMSCGCGGDEERSPCGYGADCWMEWLLMVWMDW